MFISALRLDILIWESMGTDTLLEPLVGVGGTAPLVLLSPRG